MSTLHSKQWNTAGIPHTPKLSPRAQEMQDAAWKRGQKRAVILIVFFTLCITVITFGATRGSPAPFPEPTATPEPDGPEPTMTPIPTPTLNPEHDYTLFRFHVYFRNGEIATIVAGFYKAYNDEYVFKIDIPERAADEWIATIERSEVQYIKKGLMARDSQGTWLIEQ